MIESCDTNILIYYLNKSCSEHEAAKAYLSERFSSDNFAICELVLVELYVLLRNSAVFIKPSSGAKAWEIVNSFRQNPSWRVVDHPGNTMDVVWAQAKKKNFPRRAIFDSRLAHCLLHHGVSSFATRNHKDFKDYPKLGAFSPI